MADLPAYSTTNIAASALALQGRLEVLLRLLACRAATGEIDLHVRDGRATLLDPPRLPHDPDAPATAGGDGALSREQRRVLAAVGTILQEVARSGASGHIWVVIRDGVPQYPPLSAFLTVLPAGRARRDPA